VSLASSARAQKPELVVEAGPADSFVSAAFSPNGGSDDTTIKHDSGGRIVTSGLVRQLAVRRVRFVLVI